MDRIAPLTIDAIQRQDRFVCPAHLTDTKLSYPMREKDVTLG